MQLQEERLERLHMFSLEIKGGCNAVFKYLEGEGEARLSLLQGQDMGPAARRQMGSRFRGRLPGVCRGWEVLSLISER